MASKEEIFLEEIGLDKTNVSNLLKNEKKVKEIMEVAEESKTKDLKSCGLLLYSLANKYTSGGKDFLENRKILSEYIGNKKNTNTTSIRFWNTIF